MNKCIFLMYFGAFLWPQITEKKTEKKNKIISQC